MLNISVICDFLKKIIFS